MAKIDIDNLPSNSFRSKEEPKTPDKKVNPVISSTAKVRDKSLGSKFRDVFIGEEIKDAKSYILFDVIVPSIKEMIVDAVENAVEMIFGVTGRGRRSRSSSSAPEKTSYQAYYKSKSETRRTSRDVYPSEDDKYEGKEFIFDTKGDAEMVLDTLLEILDQYPQVSVADLYDAVGRTPDFTDYKFGWTNLKSAYTKRVRDGYLLVLPRPIPIE